MNYQTQFVEACYKGDLDTVKLLLSNQRALAASLEAEDNYAIRKATRNR